MCVLELTSKVSRFWLHDFNSRTIKEPLFRTISFQYFHTLNVNYMYLKWSRVHMTITVFLFCPADTIALENRSLHCEVIPTIASLRNRRISWRPQLKRHCSQAKRFGGIARTSSDIFKKQGSHCCWWEIINKLIRIHFFRNFVLSWSLVFEWKWA